MEPLSTSRSRTRWLVGLVAGVATLMLPVVLVSRETSRAASSTKEVSVTIESLHTGTNIDNLSEADFFAKVDIDGETSKSPVRAGEDRLAPKWRFSHATSQSSGTIPIEIEIVDADDFLNGGDDVVDATTGDGKRVQIDLDLADCTFSGTTSGSCGETVDDGDLGGVAINFRITAEAPASQSGLNVRCTHSPLWPDGDEQVTVKAEALDGSLGPRTADEVQVWVNDRDTAAQTSRGVQSSTHTVGPFSDDKSFSYGCKVVDDGVEVFSGWKRVVVGGPYPLEHAAGAVPVGKTAPLSSAIDVVFVADGDNYSGPSDSQFVSDVADLIKQGYYSAGSNVDNELFLENQDQLNFWLAQDTGDASAYDPDSANSCDHDHPFVSWADAKAVIHTDNFRDCAPGGERVFSTEPGSLRTALHETGHEPFGLADEYGRDGGYFELETKPNLYDKHETCESDGSNLGRGSDPTCRDFTEAGIVWYRDETWYTSEPDSNDMMNDNKVPQTADRRRINWIFDLCRSAECGADHLDEETEDIESRREAPTDPSQDQPPPLEGSAPQSDDKVTVVDLRFTGRDQVETVDTRVEYGRLPTRVGNPPLLRTAMTGSPEGQSQLLDLGRAWHPLWQFGAKDRFVCREDWHELRENHDPPLCVAGEAVYEAERVTVDPVGIADEAVGRFVMPFSPHIRTFRVWDIAAGDDAVDDDPDDALTEVDLEPALVEFCNDHPDDEQCAEYEGPSASDDADGDGGGLVVLPGESITVDVLANDLNTDGDPLSVTGIPDPPANGDAEVNDDDTVTYTPAPGFTGEDRFTYRIADPAGATDVGTVTVTVQPDEPETVAACPQDAVPDARFTDTAGNVHAFNIDCIAWYGITQGTTPDTYSPAEQVRRDQMASFLARLLEEAGVDLPAAQDQGFGDIDGNAHAERINQLAELGITEGVTSDVYAPAQWVRRDQMASFLVRAYEHLDHAELAAPSSGFADTAVNPHETNIDKAAAADFTEGVTADAYAPANPVRRDQMASFLARTLEQGAADGHVTPPS